MQPKPKMLIFSYISSPEHVTQAAQHLLFLMQELQPYFNCVLVLPEEGATADQARMIGIPVLLLEIPAVYPLHLPWPHVMDEPELNPDLPSWTQLIKLLQREQPSIVLANTAVQPLPAIAAKALGIPVIWAAMEPFRPALNADRSAAAVEQLADVVVGLSETTLAPLRTPVLLPKSYTLSPSWHPESYSPERWSGFREHRRSQLGITSEQLVVGFYSSSIHEANGLDHFMRMAVEVAERFPQAIFFMAGAPVDPGYFESCLDIARNRGLIERFRWVTLGEQPESIYPAMDVVVIPGLTPEAFGMTALHAMVFGKPIVVYRSGGLTEIAQATGNTAYMVPVGDTDGLFTRVCSLLGDPKRRLAAGIRNEHAARAVFGIEKYRKRLAAFVLTLTMKGLMPLQLVKGSSRTVYLYEQGVLRPFQSEEAFLTRGFSFSDVRVVPDPFIAVFPKGSPLEKLGVRPRRRRKKRLLKGRSRIRRRVKSGDRIRKEFGTRGLRLRRGLPASRTRSRRKRTVTRKRSK